MIYRYYLEFKYEQMQTEAEHALYAAGAPFIDADKVSELSLEEFDKTLPK